MWFSVIEKLISILNGKYLENLTHNKLEMCMRVKQTIKKLDFFDIDELFDNYISGHIKNFELYLVKLDFIIIFEKEFHPHIKSKLKNDKKDFPLKTFLFLRIDYFSETWYEYSHNYEMGIATIYKKKYMTYEFYIEQPMQLVEV